MSGWKKLEEFQGCVWFQFFIVYYLIYSFNYINRNTPGVASPGFQLCQLKSLIYLQQLIIDRLICKMIRTPLKLKRDTLSVLSTIDRTVPIHNKNQTVQLSRIVPAFVSTDGKPIQKSQYEPSKPIMLDSAKINTNQIEKQMEKIIDDEKTLSKRNRALAKGSHFYNIKPVQAKIAMGALSPIPQKVRKIYDKMASESIQKIEFKQGVLCNASIYYFAIGGKVLFYDIGSAIKYGDQLQNYYAHQIQFDQSIYEIKQINWKHPIFREFKNRNIIVISSPWKIRFAALQFQAFEEGNERSPRWMRITQLNTNLQTNTHKTYNLTQSQNYIYYLDENGRVNRLSIERSDWLSRIISKSTSKYRLSQVTKPVGITSKSLYVSNRTSFLERLRHYSKVILAQTTSFYSNRIKNIDLACDNKRKLLYSLVNTNFSLLDDASISSYKMLTCWDISDNKLNKKCQISELELYDRHIQPIVNYNNPSNYRIQKIEAIDPSFDNECNLMAVLQCGVRIYIRVDYRFQVLHYHLPPTIENISSVEKNREAKQSYKQVELTHSYFSGNTAIFNLKEENDNHTILIWKVDERKECENSVEVVWGSNMSKGAVGDVPLQNYISKVSLCPFNSKKQQILKSLFPNSTHSPLSYAHELAKSLFCFPDVFVHSTDRQIQYFTVLRSVDKMMNALLSNIKDEHILCKIFEEYSSVDVQYLLIQIFCDFQGFYLKDLNLIDCITYFQKKCLKSGGTDFDKFQCEFSENSIKASIKYENAREIHPILIGRQAVTPEIKARILQFLFKISVKRENQYAKYSTQIYQSICNSILTYLSRLLKFIWKKDLRQINNKIALLIHMIKPLIEIIQYFSSPQIASKINSCQQKQAKFVKSILIERVRTINEVKPTDNNKEHSLKMLNKYINKIIQLIYLCQKVDLNLNRTFCEGLSLQCENYEEYLFRFLVNQYEDPIQHFYIYKQHFPYFIGENLEKAVKIYQQAKSKSKIDVLAILKFHTKVPNYLLNFYQHSSVLYPEQVRQIKNNSSMNTQQRQSINCSSDKDSISYYLKQLQQAHKSLPQRNILIVAISSMLNHYLIKCEQRQDKFYKEKKAQLQKVQKKVNFQELIIEQYQQRSENVNNQIVNQLKNTLYDEQMLGQFQNILQSQKISIIFFILFRRIDKQEIWQKVQSSFCNMLNLSIKEQQEEKVSLISKAKSYIKHKLKKQRSKWSTLQADLASIVTKTQQYISVQQLTQLFVSSILQIQPSNQNFQSQILNVIEVFCNYKNKESICYQAGELRLPIASLILFKAGVERSELYRYYENWLRKYGEKGLKIKQEEKKLVLYNWINMFCLSLQIEPRWQFLLFNIKDLKQNYCTSFPSQKKIMEQMDSLCQTFAEMNNMRQLYHDIFTT